jgi:hypothetical protein
MRVDHSRFFLSEQAWISLVFLVGSLFAGFLPDFKITLAESIGITGFSLMLHVSIFCSSGTEKTGSQKEKWIVFTLLLFLANCVLMLWVGDTATKIFCGISALIQVLYWLVLYGLWSGKIDPP